MKKIIIPDTWQGEVGRVIVEFENGRRFALCGDGTVEEWIETGCCCASKEDRCGQWTEVRKKQK